MSSETADDLLIPARECQNRSAEGRVGSLVTLAHAVAMKSSLKKYKPSTKNS